MAMQPSTTLDTFPSRLRRARERRGWSLGQLAAASGLTKEGIRQLELPTADPKVSTIYKLASALKVPAAELLGISTASSSEVDEAPEARPSTGVYEGLGDAWEGTSASERSEFCRGMKPHLLNALLKSRAIKATGYRKELLALTNDLLRQAQKDRVSISLSVLCSLAGKIKQLVAEEIVSESEKPSSEVDETGNKHIVHAHEAINCLKRIPVSASTVHRNRCFQLVTDWIRHYP